MGGWEMAQIIRTQPPFSTDPQLRATPIIALGLFNIRRDLFEKKGLEAGINDLVNKPLKLRELRQILLKWTRWQLVQDGPGVPPRWAGAWGALPFRQYQGPRSRM